MVDDRWATVGSSNIDPYSLLMAREANVFVRDPNFADELRRLMQMIEHGAGPVAPERLGGTLALVQGRDLGRVRDRAPRDGLLGYGGDEWFPRRAAKRAVKGRAAPATAKMTLSAARGLRRSAARTST